MAPTTPVCLTIAGSDSSAGAGLQADLKTFGAFGVYGLTVATCVVAEVPGKVARIDGVPAENVRAQIELLLRNFPIAAIKTGLLYSAEIAALVADFLENVKAKIPLVIDPVIIATSGDPLLESTAVKIYQERLFSRATLVTPNMEEAAVLSDQPVRDLNEMEIAGKFLAQEFGVPFLVKGGHLRSGQATDLLFRVGGKTEFSAPFLLGVRTHGTGCTYSAAITAGLAQGDSLGDAIARAKEFVRQTIAQHLRWPSSLGEIHALKHF